MRGPWQPNEITNQKEHKPMNVSKEVNAERGPIEAHGKYMRVTQMEGHPLADARGRIPLHRLILWEHLDLKHGAACWCCGYFLPWKSTLTPAYLHVVNVDHIDSDTSNNDLDNLAPACWWCNANRSWAEVHLKFWGQWTRWMKDVPPNVRPPLAMIAYELGIVDTTNGAELVRQREAQQ